MDIREKTLAGLIALFALVTFTMLVLSLTILPGSYQAIEKKDMADNVGILLANIHDEFVNLGASVSDWGPWDDLYSYAQGVNPAFERDNLAKNTYANLHLNFIVITNASGGIVYGQAYNFTDSRFSPLPADLAREVTRDQSPLRPANASRVSGFLVFPGFTAMAASYPVLHSDLSGSPAGTVIMGRYLDDAEIRSFSLPSQTPPSFSHVSPGESVIREPGVQVVPASEETIEGKTTITDINGSDALVLSLQKSRDFYQQGKQTIQFFLIVQLAIMLIFGVFIVYRIDHSILVRLNSIIKDTRAVSDGSALRIGETGDDEITLLAGAMNQMIDRLERSHADLRDNEEKFRSFVEESTEGYILLDNQGQVIEWNAANERITGISRNDAFGKPFIDIQIRLLVPEHRTPEHIDRLKQVSASIVDTGTFSRYYQPLEIRIVRPDGTRRTLQQIIFPIRTSKELHFGIINRDVTESRQAEEALQQSRRKLNLLNIVTFQDIRNTVFALLGYHELAKTVITSPEGKDFLKKEDVLLRKMDTSIKVAKDYQDLGINPPSWRDVNEVFILALSHLDTLDLKRTIVLDGLEIYSDPLLEKVFFLIIENSLIHSGGVTAISLTYHKKEDLTLTFEDNGKGIPAEEKELIFERGYSDGLGLFLAREILSITGMTIRETGTGRGTRLIIVVPAGMYRFKTDRK